MTSPTGSIPHDRCSTTDGSNGGDGVVSRTLLVRDGPGLKELAEAIRRSSRPTSPRLEEVNDLYEALSEIAAGFDGTALPVRSLAVTVRGVGDSVSAAREAIRIIDPRVRLILLTPRGSMEMAAESGFDDVVLLPVGSAELAAALQIETETAEGLRPGNQRPADRVAPTGFTASNDTTMRSARPLPDRSPSPPQGQRDVVELVIDDAIQAFAARRDRENGPIAPASPTAVPDTAPRSIDVASESLGDTDLVDAVLEGGERLERVALSLIRRELGITDIRLVPPQESEVESSHSAASSEVRIDVRFGSRTYGTLVSGEADLSSLRPWADWLAHWLRLDTSHQELRLFAWTDELTGAGNRRAFDRVLEETISEARRERRSFSLMYFDIDDFKSYNDRFGHDAGDEVLREVVELLRAVIRRGDHVFRVGGDEFVVIFADSRSGPGGPGSPPLESVTTIANRFRDRVCDLKLSQLGLDAVGSLSVSAGVSTYPWDGHDARSLLSHADQLALRSKRGGKNTISFGPGACGLSADPRVQSDHADQTDPDSDPSRDLAQEP
ncbi:MAG: GGDEF domain-containing protein [Phycisphaerae bacterium]|jgi:diguanylate cyclase (GGDEF)-like protein|nr:GGDEF domain-containing protein [Phycisphaerae bacterium]